MLISEISGEPWDHKVITFSENSKIHTVTSKTFQEKLKFLQALQNDTDRSTNFKAVFNCILDMAKKLQLPEEKIIKTIFVFTDKEFKDASKNPWLQDYRASRRNFMEAGYGNVMPQIVFWNLQGSRAQTATNGGVMILKGFSNNLLELFLEHDFQTFFRFIFFVPRSEDLQASALIFWGTEGQHPWRSPVSAIIMIS